ncbi:MAG: hypothetical protein JWM61_2479 [Micrococcaceae bacterium]|jgi:hypothetical protein|nr:hypothetical protein [Micrococcaceae bacterium]
MDCERVRAEPLWIHGHQANRKIPRDHQSFPTSRKTWDAAMVILYRLKGNFRPRVDRPGIWRFKRGFFARIGQHTVAGRGSGWRPSVQRIDPSRWASSLMVDGRRRVYRLPAVVGQDLLQDDRYNDRDHQLHARHQDEDGFALGASAESVPVPRPQPTIRYMTGMANKKNVWKVLVQPKLSSVITYATPGRCSIAARSMTY